MRLLFFVIICMNAFNSFASDVSFVVYHSKQSILKTGAPKALKKGDQLSSKDIVWVGTSGQLVLLCSNYKIIQVSKPGAYTVKALLAMCNKTAASYNTAYFKYVWEQFTRPEGSPDKNPEAYMKNVGAVSRGCNEVTVSIRSDTTHFYAGHLPIFWSAVYDSAYATLYEHAYDGAALRKIPLLKGQPLELGDLLAGVPAGSYYWQVEGSQGSACERKYLELWKKERYKKQIAALLKDIPPSTPAEKAFAAGFLMQEHFFFAEAIKWYRKAIKLEPENSTYNKAIETFYEKNF